MIECVPNVSEGRDAAVIGQLAAAVESGGARLIDVHSDVDHHRSVFTLLGDAEAVERSALALARAAVQLVDLTKHSGAHPRVGALDVMPFVPLGGASMHEVVAVAHRVGRRVARECSVPVFFYAEAALRPERRELPLVRRGGFEQLTARLGDVAWRPDAGPSSPHPTAGAAVIGARHPLIAFNAVLDTADLPVAARIARAMREPDGDIRAVRALGLFLSSRQLAQVSMNLLDYRRVPVQAVAERVAREARGQGVRVKEYELVGCAPADQFERWPDDLPPVAGLKPSQLLDPSLFAIGS